jgi:hypothetical protein
MRRASWIAAAALAIGSGLVAWGVLSAPTDEELIAGRLEQLAHAVHIPPGEKNALRRMVDLKSAFSEIFVKEVSYRIPELSSRERGRQELVELAAQASSFYDDADVDLRDVDIRMDPSRAWATVNVSANLHGTPRAGAPGEVHRRVSFRFDKLEGSWKIGSLDVMADRDGN